MDPPERIQRLRTPCADGLGERTKRRRLGRALSPRDGTRQPPRCRTHVPEPGLDSLRAGLALTRLVAPRTFRGFDEARSWANKVLPDTITEGPAPAFRPSRSRSTLSRGR
jgi:hypothetical protein